MAAAAATGAGRRPADQHVADGNIRALPAGQPATESLSRLRQFVGPMPTSGSRSRDRIHHEALRGCPDWMFGGPVGSRSAPNRRTRGPSSVPGAARSQGQPGLQAGDHHRSQADRHHVLRRLLHLLLHRRPDGAVHAHRAGAARAAVPVQRAVQPAVHHARHGDAAVLRDPDRVRVRQPGAAAADRRARRGVPAAERVLVLAVPVRRDDRDRRLHHPRRRRRLRLDRLHAR